MCGGLNNMGKKWYGVKTGLPKTGIGILFSLTNHFYCMLGTCKTGFCIYFILVLLFSGLSTTFFRSHEGLIVLWAVGLVIFIKQTQYPSKKLYIALGVWMGYFAISTFIIRSFHPFFMGTYIAKIMIAWWLLSHYKERIFLKYENTVFALAVISLFFYVIQMSVPNSLYGFMKSIDLSQDLFPKIYYAGTVIYTIISRDLAELFPRNAGFCWEAGPYSCYIVLAIFFNLARNGLRLKDKKRLGILLLTLITTQSTTGMVSLMAVILWYAWSRYENRIFRIISVPLALGVVIYLFTSVPYLREKIISESEQDADEIISLSIEYGGSYNPGRFAGLYLGWQDFKSYPVAGIGGNVRLSYAAQYGAEVSMINGFANIVSRYGAIGVLLFLTLLFTSGKWIARHYQYSMYFIFPALLLIISFGFGIIEAPIIVTFWLVSVFGGINHNKNACFVASTKFLKSYNH